MTNKERMDKVFLLLTEAAELSSNMSVRDFNPDELQMKLIARDYLPHLVGRVLESVMWCGALKGLFDEQAEKRQAKQLDNT